MSQDQSAKTVFLSYRRDNAPWALTIGRALEANGYDVFLDCAGQAGGDFEQAALENIAARAHFVALLTPSAMKRCADPSDRLRREIETALDSGRNVAPVFLEGFDIHSPSIAAQLTGKLEQLKQYKGIELPIRYLKYALMQLQDEFLNTEKAAPVTQQLSPIATAVAKLQKEAAKAAPAVQEAELTAQYWFERASNAGDPEEIIRHYGEAIKHMPDYAAAYLNCGNARLFKGDLDGAVADYSETIRINPNFANAYFNRGAVRIEKGDYATAVADFDEAIRLAPGDALAYHHRAQAKEKAGDAEGAQCDYDEAQKLGYKK